MKIIPVETSFRLEREDGVEFTVSPDVHPDFPNDWYLIKDGEFDPVGYYPSAEAAIEAAKTA